MCKRGQSLSIVLVLYSGDLWQRFSLPCVVLANVCLVQSRRVVVAHIDSKFATDLGR